MNTPAPLQAHPATLVALLLFTLVSLGLGVVANRVTSKKTGFLEKYFLGNRSLGAIAVALTAAVMSGGTFMGFPSLVYTHGWVVGLWICSYMVAPLMVLGVLGKRIGQLGRRTGAVTLPDLFRERYGSPTLGLLTSILIMFFLTCNLVPQFKAGALIMKIVLPSSSMTWVVDESMVTQLDAGYYVGLVIFTATVVAYTAYGGFLAAIWTDVFQSIIMAIGVMILFPLAMYASGGLHQATLNGMTQAGNDFGFGPGAGRNFHPLTLAFSFFAMWTISGMGQPSTMVRLMAFRDSRTLRWSIIYVTIYNVIIYVPLIFIFVAARSILPDLGTKSDEVMPRLVIHLANPYLAGLILAAPYGAVMSTVSGFMLIVASGFVRDIFQRFCKPNATEKQIERASYAATIAVGLIAATLALRPPQFLQLIVVFASSGMAAAFLVPALFAAFWRRATYEGAIAAMVSGTLVHLSLYATFTILKNLDPSFDQGLGPKVTSHFGAYYLAGFDPLIWSMIASLTAGVVGSLLSNPPDPRRVALLFDVQPKDAPAPASLDLRANHVS